MRRRPIRLVLLLGLLALVAPEAARAADITGASFALPVDPAQPVFDLRGGQGPGVVRVQGTAVGGDTTGETTRIACRRRGITNVLLSASVDPTSRAFTAVLDASLTGLEEPCRLYALPAGGPIPAAGDLAPFAGPRYYPSRLDEQREANLANPNAGVLADLDLASTVPDRRSTARLWSFGGCGLWAARPLEPDQDPGAPALNVFDCAGFADDQGRQGGATRSDVQIDGENAFNAAMARNSVFTQVPGLPPLAMSTDRDPVTGLLSTTERSSFVRCLTRPAVYPPALASEIEAVRQCGRWVPTGVALERTLTQDRDGRRTTAADRFVSEDGGAHALDVMEEVTMGSQFYGLSLPWTRPDFAAYPADTTLPGSPAAPGSLYVVADLGGPDGDVTAGTGAVSFSTAPTSVEFASYSSNPSIFPELRYVRTIPAGGATEIVHTFSMAPSLAEVQALAASAEDRFSGPAVSIDQPTSGSSPRRDITVSGRASDASRVASVTLNGVGLAIGAGGAWSAQVALEPGPNVLTAVATDGEGQRAQATLQVDYALPPQSVPSAAPKACVVPTLAGQRLAVARQRLRKAGCTLKRIRSVYVAPRVVRKGRRTFRVTTTPGTVVSTLPGARQRLKPKAGVELRVQRATAVRPKPKPKRQGSGARGR